MGVRHPTSALGWLQCHHLRVAGREQDPSQGPRCVHSPLHAWPVPGGSSAEAISLSKHARICSANSSCRCTAGRSSERNRMHRGAGARPIREGTEGVAPCSPQTPRRGVSLGGSTGPASISSHTHFPSPSGAPSWTGDRRARGYVPTSWGAGTTTNQRPALAPPLSPPHHRHSHTPPEHHPWPEPLPPSGSPRPMHGGA